MEYIDEVKLGVDNGKPGVPGATARETHRLREICNWNSVHITDCRN